MKQLFKLIYITTCLILIGCGSNSNTNNSQTSSNNSSPIAFFNSSIITIDNTGIIPIINDSPTSSIVYVHNNSSSQITNITYDAITSNSLFNTAIINPNSIKLCQTIEAHGECPLAFTTPNLDKGINQGSFIIAAHYTDKAINKNFSQIFNYKKVNNHTIDSGVQIMSGVDIYGFGNEVGYATVYLYNNDYEADYSIKSIRSFPNSIDVYNGNITGTTMQKNFVQAVEVSGQIANEQPYMANLSIQSTNLANKTYNNSVNLTIDNSSGSQSLLLGSIPVADTSNSSERSGSILAINLSNHKIDNINVQAPSGVSLDTSNCQAIDIGANCIINYTLPQYSGSGFITISGMKDDSSIPITNSEPIIWFNSQSSPLLNVSTDPNDQVVFFSGSTGAIANINVTNSMTGIDIESLDVSSISTISGMAKVELISGMDNCSGKNLIAKTGSCSYAIKLTDDQAENGIIHLYVKGKYKLSEATSQDYSRAIALRYNSIANNPVLIISGLSDMQISGNNKDLTTQDVTITNVGNSAGKIDSLNLNKSIESANLVITNIANCLGVTLAANGGSCTMKVQLGSQTYSGSAPLTSSSSIIATYSNGSTKTSTLNSNAFRATITSYTPSIEVISVSASNNRSGNGLESLPYIFSAANPSSEKTVTITYKNTGTNPIIFNLANFDLNHKLWVIDTDNCTNKTLDTSGNTNTCTIILNNVFSQNIQFFTDVGAAFEMNLPLPEVTITDTIAKTENTSLPKFSDLNKIYVTNHQATIANNIHYVVGENGTSLIVSHNLANASDYADGTIQTITNISNDNYFTNIEAKSDGCSIHDLSSNPVTQTCIFANLESGNKNLSVTYKIDDNLTNSWDINVILQSITIPGVSLAMSPTNIITHIQPFNWTLEDAIEVAPDSSNVFLSASKDGEIMLAYRRQGAGYNGEADALFVHPIFETIDNYIEENPSSYINLLFNSHNIPYAALKDDKTLAVKVKVLDVLPPPFVADDYWLMVGNNVTQNGSYVSLGIDANDTIYVAFLDNTDGNAKLVKLVNNNWVAVGQPFATGGVASNIKLEIDSTGAPYIAYFDTSSNKAIITKYNGSNWVLVGSQLANVINSTLNFKISNTNDLYIAFSDSTQNSTINVMKFNGTDWQLVGDSGFSNATAPSLAISNDGLPYIAYKIPTITGRVMIMKFYNNKWISEGYIYDIMPWIDIINLSLVINPASNIPFLEIYHTNGTIQIVHLNTKRSPEE